MHGTGHSSASQPHRPDCRLPPRRARCGMPPPLPQARAMPIADTYSEEGELVDGLARELEAVVEEIEAVAEEWKDVGERGSWKVDRGVVVVVSWRQ